MQQSITKSALARQLRAERLLPNGVPRYIRVYDNNNETIDRYTIVFTGHYRGRVRGGCDYVGSSGAPFHPQGFYQHGEHDRVIDYPSYKHLGKKIKYTDLPEDVQKAVMSDYIDLWEIKKDN